MNIPPWAQIVTYVAGTAAMGVFAYGVYRHVQKWRLGKAEKVDWAWGERLNALLKYAVAQMRVVTDAYAGAMHLAIFWGMVFLAMATAIATVDWDVTKLLMDFQFLKGNFYLIYELVADLFGIALIAGLALGLYRRYVMKPKKLETPYPPTFGFDSAYLLLILMGVAITGFLAEGGAAGGAEAAVGCVVVWRLRAGAGDSGDVTGGVGVTAPCILDVARSAGARVHRGHSVVEGVPHGFVVGKHFPAQADADRRAGGKRRRGECHRPDVAATGASGRLHVVRPLPGSLPGESQRSDAVAEEHRAQAQR